MKRLKMFLPLVLSLFCFYSCDKNDDSNENQDSYSDQIILKDLKVVGDTITLTWTKLDALNFSGYLIVRKDSKNTDVDPSIYQNVVAQIYDPGATSYTDKNIPLAPYLEYQVIGILSNNSTHNYIFSNSKAYQRPEIKVFGFNILDVIPDLSKNRFYIIEKNEGKISIFNYETLETVKSITTGATIGYCSLGLNAETRELYVPRNDGWVFVYNSETLEKIDQIDIGHPSSCVINNNGKLFISTDAWTERPLKVFDRASKLLVSENGDFEDTRLRRIPNTNTEIIEVTLHIGPTDLDYYRFDASGNFVLHQNDKYHGDYPLSAEIFQFFPDGNNFITGSEGAIYDIRMNYINRLPHGNLSYSDYAFNADASLIYCSCSNAKLIVSYSNNNFVKVKEYKTVGYPFKIYRKDNALICLSNTAINSNYSAQSKFIIEKIQL
ncbi:MAG TPA: hypothetical protein PKH02_08885 [Bacteroidales bacterium]|nr:hypothetical protein [Bacteroidales bacterium]HPT22358.1 hypothetical protein [Bacteroidales bacterium]